MSGVDAAFLYFETPSSHMHVLATLVVDTTDRPGWGAADVVALIRERIELMPALRRRVVTATLRLHHPVWVDVEEVDVDAHVEKVSTTGGMEALAVEVARFAERQLDRRRPLWEILVVEGLADGLVGFTLKIHHCATDGVGAAKLMAGLFDLSPDPITDEDFARRRGELAAEAIPEPGLVDVALHTVTGIATRPWKLATAVPSAVRSVARVVQLHAGSTDTSGGALPFQAPRASFNGRISPGRTVSYVDLSLADVKAIKNAVGGTVNDAVIAICGGAFRNYLEARGELPTSSLISAVPVSVRAEGDTTTANAVSAMFTSLGTDIADPLERLRAVRQANLVGKGTQKAMGDNVMTHVGELAPPTLTTFLARAYTGLRLADLHPVVHNVVISNVPGPPIQIYLGGVPVRGMYPLGPVLEGPGLNITLVSYRDRIDVGLIACRERMPDLDDLAAAFPAAVTELLAAL